MTVEASTIATDEIFEKLKLRASSPNPLILRVEYFVKLSFTGLEPACSAAFKARFQWLYGGNVTSAVLFDRSFLQFEPSVIPVYRSVRIGHVERIVRSRMEPLTEFS